MLVTKKLHIGYGKKCVQHDLDLHAAAGELICLIGTNGAGKSTLLRTLAGLQPSLGGEIEIDNRDASKLSLAQRSRLLSLVLTDSISVENLSVFDLVAMGRFPYTDWAGRLSETDRKIVETVLKQVNLWYKKTCKIAEVSDGEKQRAIIAKALAQDTPLVLLDEPTAHLDLPNRVDTMLLLRQLASETQKTFILSTHELDLALQTADRIWLMTASGIDVGTPEELIKLQKLQSAFGSESYSFDENDGRICLKNLRK